MMWIWYLLLGSGSGSHTVGEYLKQAGTKVSGVCFLCVCVCVCRVWRRGGLLDSLKREGCAASFSSHSWTNLHLLVHYFEELILLFHFHRVGAHFLGDQLVQFFVFLGFGFEPVESIPRGARPLRPSVF